MGMTLVDCLCEGCGHEDTADLDDLKQLGALRCEDCGEPMGPLSDGVDAQEWGAARDDDDAD